MTEKQLGVINYWNDKRGFGFLRHATVTEAGQIARIDNPKFPDTFCHVRQLEMAGIRDIDEGDAFLFDVGPDPKSGRPCAIDLELVRKNAAAT
jgi:cold shock CspA family protein